MLDGEKYLLRQLLEKMAKEAGTYSTLSQADTAQRLLDQLDDTPNPGDREIMEKIKILRNNTKPIGLILRV